MNSIATFGVLLLISGNVSMGEDVDEEIFHRKALLPLGSKCTDNRHCLGLCCHPFSETCVERSAVCQKTLPGLLAFLRYYQSVGKVKSVTGVRKLAELCLSHEECSTSCCCTKKFLTHRAHQCCEEKYCNKTTSNVVNVSLPNDGKRQENETCTRSEECITFCCIYSYVAIRGECVKKALCQRQQRVDPGVGQFMTHSVPTMLDSGTNFNQYLGHDVMKQPWGRPCLGCSTGCCCYGSNNYELNKCCSNAYCAQRRSNFWLPERYEYG